MNIVFILVLLVLILMCVIYLFSVDDKEDESNFFNEADQNAEQSNNTAEQKNIDEKTKLSNEQNESAQKHLADGIAEINSRMNGETEQEPEQGQETAQIIEIKPAMAAQKTKAGGEKPIILPEIGGEEDFKIRANLTQALAPASSAETKKIAVACVQLRVPEQALASNALVSLIREAETVFDKPFSFDFTCYAGPQLNKLLYFDFGNERRDAVLEALIVSFELVARFKKLIRTNTAIKEAKIKIAIGLSMGNMIKISRGLAAEPTWVGKPAYVAESIAEAGGDLTIYTDETIGALAIPLFNFRELKPAKLRMPLHQIKLYELVGFNEPAEIDSYAVSKKTEVRKAVAISYRYLKLGDDIHPLIELLSDTQKEVAEEALKTLAEIGDDRLFGFTKRIFLETKDPSFRSLMLDAFAKMGKPELVPLILGSTKENSWNVRLSAAKALFALAGEDSLKYLEDLLNDADGAVKAAVNSIFFKVTGKNKYFNELANFVLDLSKRARKVALDELLDIASDEAVKIIVDSFTEQELELRKYVLRRLEVSKSKILYQSLLIMFKKSDEKTRPYVVEALRRSGLVN